MIFCKFGNSILNDVISTNELIFLDFSLKREKNPITYPQGTIIFYKRWNSCYRELLQLNKHSKCIHFSKINQQNGTANRKLWRPSVQITAQTIYCDSLTDYEKVLSKQVTFNEPCLKLGHKLLKIGFQVKMRNLSISSIQVCHLCIVRHWNIPMSSFTEYNWSHVQEMKIQT